MEFFETVMGRRFFDSYVPRIVTALEDIANELKKINEREDKDDKSAE